MARDRWLSDDLPVLEALADAFEEHPNRVLQAGDVQALVAEDVRVEASLDRLVRGGYIECTVVHDGASQKDYLVRALEEPGLRAVGVWPTAEQAAQRFLEALQQSVEDAVTPEERTKRQKALDAARTLGAATLSGVLSTVVGGVITS